MTRWATPASRFGVVLGALLIALAAFGPWLTRNSPAEQFAESVYAPPMRPHIIERAADGTTRLRWPFVYPLRLEDRLEHRYVEDRARPMPLRVFRDGVLLSVDSAHGAPWFPLGADALGRDQLARLASGARLSLGVALGAALGALVIGVAAGGLAGFAGGLLDDGVMRVADVVVALPAVYVVLALRASMPLVLSTTASVLDDGRGAGGGGMAVSGAGCAGGRRRRTGSRVRRSCAGARREPYAVIAPSPPARRQGVPRRADDAPRAGVRARRGDAVVCRARFQRTDAQLGRNVAGSRARAGARRGALAPGAGCRPSCSWHSL